MSPIDTETTITAAGPVEVRLYSVGIILTSLAGQMPPVVMADGLTVVGLTATIPGVDVLLGLDVLLSCKLTIDGPNRTFILDL